MRSAKGIFVLFVQAKASFPSMIIKLEERVEKMLRLLSKWEAELIKPIRVQEIGKEYFNLEEIFRDDVNVGRLSSKLVSEIIKINVKKGEIKATTISKSTGIGDIDIKFYITSTGKKYHVRNCAYCKGHSIYEADNQEIADMHLKPCQCVYTLRKERLEDWENNATVFIDESIYRTMWDNDGKSGLQGNYSYIICRGHLESEDEINDENTITRGVNAINETKSTAKITKTAIWNVLMYLSYEYQFEGVVQVYVDNKTTLEHWGSNKRNECLSNLFKGVNVTYIPRELNTKADALGHSRVVIDVPKEVYKEIAMRYAEYENIKHSMNEKPQEERNNKTIWEWIRNFLKSCFEQYRGRSYSSKWI